MNNTIRIMLGAVFAVAVAFYANSIMGQATHGTFLVLAAVFGAYMAMNIGANDVANNVGPAVGAKAITIGSAIVIASIFEAAGALIAGGDVVGTIKKDIISPDAFGNDPMMFVYAMSAALLAAALWLNLATWLKAPVSTTHSIVGGVMGAGIAAGGLAIVSWTTMGTIAASWVISPVLGGVIAATFLYIIKSQVIYKADRLSAAKKVVPALVAIMSAAFITYLTLKGFKHIWGSIVEIFSFLPQTDKPTFTVALIFGLIGGVITFFIVKPRVAQKVVGLDNSREAINVLFTIPLIFAAALLSFAHGANDVANAVGPLAAVNDALTSLKVSTKASIPLWVMVTGGIGISIGLALYGPRLIRTVGSEITELDQMRAFSIMMAAAITVVIASQLGLPVSSTHIAVGAVFGVGFLREWLDSKGTGAKQKMLQEETEKHHELKAELAAYAGDDYKKKVELMEAEKAQKKNVKAIKRELRENYVKRGLVKKIIAAWLITVPAAAAVSAIIFYVLKGLAI
ncbi:inorganic phosphate transporter [Sulfurovum sp. zt1-1]|uniref:Phosphate transporter n=1 Tax=Sulfurovum zhangzhouensis TaxID=3019067 RepID=A0ABT7QXH2_9BACT|nr:inorganic phosphate transporter [Sulfurovum zhangzhouensis]MDM5271534.1 inorganic phosphate transporter [Sulfurovum zhangzhouensis]